MNTESLKALLDEASALTSSLPQEVQQVAFAKAFDVLLRERAVEPRRRRGYLNLRNSTPKRRVGPKSAVGQLLENGYFAVKRSLPEIQAHLKDFHGHDYGSNELSISLLRWVRDVRLSRAKDSAGQYAYWAAEPQNSPEARRRPDTRVHPRLLTDGGADDVGE